MRRKSLLISLLLLLTSLPLFARRFVLEVSPSAAPSVAAQYGLVIVKQIPNHNLFLVTAPDTVDVNELIRQLSADPNVSGFQLDRTAAAPEIRTDVRLDQSTSGILDSLSNVSVVSYFGTGVPSYYVDQAATSLIRLADAQANYSATGAGIVAIIDTGIDITNPMFSGTGMSAPPGFTPQPTNSGGILDAARMNNKVIVARSYMSLLNPQLVQTAEDEVGHGTFVAGCAAGALVDAPFASISGMAPGAYLGSYKVFGTPGINGSTTTAAVLAAINDAVADGMDVINISIGGLDYIPPAEDAEAVALETVVGASAVGDAAGAPHADSSINVVANIDIKRLILYLSCVVSLDCAPVTMWQ